MELYLFINLSLAAAYVLFTLGETITSRLVPQMSYQTWLRMGKVLFLAALVSPLLVKLLPDETSQQISLAVLPPLPEGDGLSVTGILSGSQLIQSNVPERFRNQQSIQSFHPELLKYLLLLSILIALSKKTYSMLSLHALLKRSIVIRKLGRVRIVASTEIVVPFSTLVGGKAWVVVPESLLHFWSDYQLAIKHELQHHRSGDTAWAILIDLFVPIFLLNPFIYLWRRRMGEIQEFSCDEVLIGHRISSYEYGSCLVRVAEAALENRRMLVGTASMAAGFENPNYFKSFLRRRVEMLSKHKTRRPCRFAGVLMGTLTIVCILALTFGADQVLASRNQETAPGVVHVVPEIQEIAQKALDAALKRHKASLGFVVVSDPNTGRILAVANEDLVETRAERTPHWSLSLRLGAASITKAFVTAAALNKSVTSVDEIHDCERGNYLYGGKVFKDWKAFDKLSTAETVIQSSNICGIKIGQKLGADGLATAFQSFGFGAGGTATGFPEARPGEVLTPPTTGDDDTKVYIATISTGYGGLYLSPVEIVQAMGAIANGGKLLKPQSDDASPVMLRRILSTETSRKMKNVLEQVMIHGTAMKSKSELYRLAGKTATGYSHTHVAHDTLGGDSNMASFVGFGPVENPRVVIYVGVENPTDGKGVHGSYHAAPVFREVAEKTLQYLDVEAN